MSGEGGYDQFRYTKQVQANLNKFALADLVSNGRYLRQYIELGHEMMNQPLCQVEREALDLFDQIMLQQEMRLDMMLQPGDMQFANNYLVLHSRTSFEDHTAPEQRRKLLRLWLKMPNARTLAPEFPGRNGFPLPTDLLQK